MTSTPEPAGQPRDEEQVQLFARLRRKMPAQQRRVGLVGDDALQRIVLVVNEKRAARVAGVSQLVVCIVQKGIRAKIGVNGPDEVGRLAVINKLNRPANGIGYPLQ